MSWKSQKQRCVNQSAIAMTKNPQFHRRAKHIDYFFRQQVTQGTIVLQYCPTEKMVATYSPKDLVPRTSTNSVTCLE